MIIASLPGAWVLSDRKLRTEGSLTVDIFLFIVITLVKSYYLPRFTSSILLTGPENTLVTYIQRPHHRFGFWKGAILTLFVGFCSILNGQLYFEGIGGTIIGPNTLAFIP